MKRQTSLILMVICVMLLSCQKSQKREQGGLVVLSPEVAEIICALGAEDQISAVTAECDYSPSLADKPKVGSFSAINKEAIIALKPRLVFSSALEQGAFGAELSKLGIKVEEVYPTSLQALSHEIKRIGGLIGREAQADSLNSRMQKSIAEIKATAGGNPRPKVYLEIYRDPLMSVADTSFVGELIETAGGDNIFRSLERDYARVKAEDVIAARPDIMICYSQDSLANIKSRKGWQDIPAVRNGRIYFEDSIDPSLLQRATPRCIEGMQKLQELIGQWRKGN